jgi:hypothetical protein
LSPSTSIRRENCILRQTFAIGEAWPIHRRRDRCGSPNPANLSGNLERFPAEWNHSVEKKSLQIQKLEHILIAQIDST